MFICSSEKCLHHMKLQRYSSMAHNRSINVSMVLYFQTIKIKDKLNQTLHTFLNSSFSLDS